MSEPTIVVQFGEDVSSDSLFIAELDDVLNVDIAGEKKTEFYSADNIFVRTHYDKSALKVTRVAVTDGNVYKQNEVNRDSEEDLLFVDSDEYVDLKYKPNSAPAVSWYGKTSTISRDGVAVKAATVPCLGKFTYKYRATIYRWKAPTVSLAKDETWPLAIVFYVENA